MTTRIDCDTCLVRGQACHDCVVTVLLGPPPELTLADDECRALDALAAGGLVPPLRLVTPVDRAGDRVGVRAVDSGVTAVAECDLCDTVRPGARARSRNMSRQPG